MGKSHFVLIHGASYGAWCWYKVATMLKSIGHNVTTIDMGACGLNTKQVQDICSILDYNEPLMTFMESLPSHEKVILVGHSFGGISISMAMEKFPNKISIAIFVAAFVISENLTYPTITQELIRKKDENKDSMDIQHFFFNGPNNPPTALLFGPKFMESKMYQLSPSEDLTLALSLVRPFPLFKDDETFNKETTMSMENNGSVPKVYIISNGDNLLTSDSQMWMVERSGPFVEVKVIMDSDHMVMFSKPNQLTSLLLEIANKY
ncbi:methyl jasmonate esterase 1-like isoform X1 [Cicer arietinum]|uniref:(S)-hydroxynitrile lyase n=1 Tax=Cicer arietinum TaxID=3827 RepID=A0A1S2Z336_CICAR|nr:methylesterase 3-like isoform X1 [Cicer arietinum]